MPNESNLEFARSLFKITEVLFADPLGDLTRSRQQQLVIVSLLLMLWSTGLVSFLGNVNVVVTFQFLNNSALGITLIAVCLYLELVYLATVDADQRLAQYKVVLTENDLHQLGLSEQDKGTDLDANLKIRKHLLSQKMKAAIAGRIVTREDSNESHIEEQFASYLRAVEFSKVVDAYRRIKVIRSIEIWFPVTFGAIASTVAIACIVAK